MTVAFEDEYCWSAPIAWAFEYEYCWSAPIAWELAYRDWAFEYKYPCMAYPRAVLIAWDPDPDP